MKKGEIMQSALEILRDENDHLSARGAERFKELLSQDVEEDVAPVPLTDERWHEYALVAIGALGPALGAAGAGTFEDIDVAAKVAARFAVGVADGVLAAAQERAK